MGRHDRTTTWKRLGTTAALALVVLAGACSRSGDQAMVARDEATSSDRQLPAAGAATAGGGAAAGGETLGAPLPKGIGEAKVVKTATIEVEVAAGRFPAVFSKVPGIAAANDGFVASSSSLQGGADGRQSAGSLVLRVPAERFDAAREQLIGLGKLRSQQLKGEDVAGRLTDLDARLRNLRSHEEAIRLLMTKTGTIGETIEVQRQLSTVREQIEQLAGEQARLTDAVAYSTLTLSLAEPGVAFSPDGDGSPLGDAVARAVDATERVLAGLIVSLGYLVPLALLLLLAWLVTRPFLARRRVTTPVLES